MCKEYKTRLYKYIGTVESTVGSGSATYDSVMLSTALSDAEKTIFSSWAKDAQYKDRRWINDIEYVVDREET